MPGVTQKNLKEWLEETSGMNTWLKDIAQWKCGDVLYLSVPFTWLLSEAEKIAKCHKGRVVAGGPAVKLMGADWAETPDDCPFDAIAFHNPCATFTTRGCPNACPFCAVPKIEGEFRELPTWKPNPIVCDNNILASSKRHFERVIDSLLPFRYVDFNQGLDAERLKTWHIPLLKKLQHVKIRFALDTVDQAADVSDAIRLCQSAGLRDISVYVLIGYDDTPEEAREKLESVRTMGICEPLRPFPMRYQPLDAKIKNGYLAPEWTDAEMRKIVQYYSRLRWNEFIPFDEFERGNAYIETRQEEMFPC